MRVSWPLVFSLVALLGSCAAWDSAETAREEASRAAVAAQVDEIVAHINVRLNRLESTGNGVTAQGH